jgi:hypothetical protein
METDERTFREADERATALEAASDAARDRFTREVAAFLDEYNRVRAALVADLLAAAAAHHAAESDKFRASLASVRALGAPGDGVKRAPPAGEAADP